MNTDNEHTSGGLSFTDNISLSWKPIDFEPEEKHLALVNESNEEFLRAAAAIGEMARDLSEDAPEISQEMARLDAKLNLLLDLVSQLIYAQLDIPEISKVTVSSDAIEWTADNIPEPGQTVFMEVYIQRGTPKPLCFYGRATNDAQGFEKGHTRVEYLGLGGNVQAWLDKLIFRHHRRAIAYRKSVNADN